MTRTPYYLFFLALGLITSENGETGVPFLSWGNWVIVSHIGCYRWFSMKNQVQNPLHIPYLVPFLPGVWRLG